MPQRHRQNGQATVELALALPVLALILACLIEAGMMGLDQIRLWHGAREAARTAVVNRDAEVARKAAARSGLWPLHMTIEPESAARTTGGPLTVRLAYRPGGHVPLLGALFEGITLNASATMRIERP